MRCLLAIIVLTAAIAPASSLADELDLACRPGDGDRVEFVTIDRPTDLIAAGAMPFARLEIDEDGKPLQVASARQLLVLPSPPRLARRVVVLDASRVRLTVAAGMYPVRFRVRRVCQPPDGADKTLEGLRALAAAASDTSAGSAAETATQGRLAQLQDSGSSAEIRAFAVHLQAQRLLDRQRSTRARDAFRAAEERWREAADPARALAARTAWAEEEYGLANYAAAVAAAPPPQALPGGAGYYLARLQNNRCLSLKQLTRFDAAHACYQSLAVQQERLDEPFEQGNSLLNLGALQRDLERDEEAERSATKARQLTEHDMPGLPDDGHRSVRGRVRLLLGDLALRRGAVGQAIQHYDAALVQFSIPGLQRWRANTLLKIAELYGQLGAYDDAYSTWTSAVRQFNFAEAPARVASAILMLARIESAQGNSRMAALLAQLSAARYRQLGNVKQEGTARLASARAWLEAGDTAAAALQLSGTTTTGNFHAARLAQAAYAIRAEDAAAALRALDVAEPADSLAMRLDGEQLRAEALRLQGHLPEARAALRRALGTLERTIADVRNPALQLLLQRESDKLTRRALAWQLENASDEDRVTALLGWLPVAAAPDAAETSRVADRPTALEGLLARQMLAGADQETAAAEMATWLGADTRPTLGRRELRATLQGVRGSIPERSVLLILMEDAHRLVALRVARTDASLHDLGAKQPVLAVARRLREQIASADSPLPAIQSNARELADRLRLAELLAGSTQLLLLADPLTESIPWPVLMPTAALALVDSHAISFVRLSRPLPSAPAAEQPPLQIALAAQSDNRSPLQPLETAARERELIAAAAPALSLQLLSDDTALTKSRLLQAIATPGSWVHVASHGASRPGYLGRSGIWLDPGADDAHPRFLGSLDLFDAGARAQLVVLNACDLGAGAAQVEGGLDFADVLSRLGTVHVVAARWPVSDGAAALWVPAFYAALAQQPIADPSAALRAAQQALLKSRAFRHPFYWASLAHWQRLALPASDPPMDPGESP